MSSLSLRIAPDQTEFVSRELSPVWWPLFAVLDRGDASVDVVVSPAASSFLCDGAEQFQGLLTGFQIRNRLWGRTGRGFSVDVTTGGESQKDCCENLHCR